MAQETIFLDKDIPLTQGEYESIRENLIPLLSYAEASLEDRLIAGAVWLDILGDFIRVAAPPLEKDDEKRKEVFKTFFASMRNEGYERPLRITRKSPGGNALKRMFLCLFLSFCRNPEKRRSNPATLLFILRNYLKGYLYLGKIRLRPFETDIPLQAFRRIRIDPMNEAWDKTILEWGSNFITNDKLLETDNIRKGYLYFLLLYAIGKRLCVAHACLKGANHPDSRDIADSIPALEKYYAYHPCLEEMFASNPVIKDIMEGLFKRKSAPMILVKE